MKPDPFEPGAIVRIPLEDGSHTYGRMLSHSPFIAYYDYRTHDEVIDLNAIAKSPVLFVSATIEKKAIKSGRWKKVGVVALDAADVPIPLRFMQSLGDPSRLRVLDHLGNARPSTFEECEGLERAAVWDAEHVEGRLNDHYAGRPNVALESMKLVTPAS